jgi:hypothetical protein
MQSLKKYFWTAVLCTAASVKAQEAPNCFLANFQPGSAEIPAYTLAEKPAAEPTVIVTISASDGGVKASKYILGTSVAAWTGQVGSEPVLTGHLQRLAPPFIRYPGGSWADIFFWNGKAAHVPDSLYDASTKKTSKFSPQYGTNSWPTTVSNWYQMRSNVKSEGLITVNYGYARYGTGANPAAEAAHYAADWVREDGGRTRFWEVGNESGGPWEAGWQIDPKLNHDGQPAVITGELYGRHFRAFADSMRNAARDVGAEIYIGAQILHYDGTNSWNVADRAWNAGVFREAGGAADFYVVHNYFPSTGLGTARNYMEGSGAIGDMMTFMRKDMNEKKAAVRPVAVTEWNISGSLDKVQTSFVDGMQATLIFGEMLKNGYGMSSRWLIAGDANRIFAESAEGGAPKWNPYPDFFYMYYFRKVQGDLLVPSSVSGSADFSVYAFRFGSGHVGAVVVNKGTAAKTVRFALDGYRLGSRFYIYSLTGGTDNGEFSQKVYVNEIGPDYAAGGPIKDLTEIEAVGYLCENDVKFPSPGRSVQFVLVEGNTTGVTDRGRKGRAPDAFELGPNYPNPFNPETRIPYSLGEDALVLVQVVDLTGRLVATLADGKQPAGKYTAVWNGRDDRNRPAGSGVYVCTMRAGNSLRIRKMILMK